MLESRNLAQPAPVKLTTDRPGMLVVGVDDSESSLRAVAYAAGIARRQRFRLIAAHVIPDRIPWAEWMPDGGLDARTAARHVARQLQAQVESATADYGVPVEFLVLHGDPYTELSQLADEQWADAVIVGTSTKAEHRPFGSVAVRLVQWGRWPVTVVP